MTSILGITAPIFILIALGFTSVRSGLLSREHIRGMGVFVIKIALPALVVNALMHKQLHEIWQPQYLFAYGIASLLACAIGLYVYYRRFGEPLQHAAIMSMGASMSNTGFIGYGLLTMIIGNQAAVYFSMTLIIENLLMVPIILTLAELGRQQSAQTQASIPRILLHTFANVAKNPLIISLCVGLLLSGLQAALPQPIERVLAMLATCAAPLAIFVIGGNLVGTNIQAAGKHALIISAIKLVVMPLTVFVLLSLLPHVSEEMRFAGVLLASVSMATMYSLLGQHYGIGERSAAVLLITTLLMFFSVTTVLWCWSHYLQP